MDRKANRTNRTITVDPTTAGIGLSIIDARIQRDAGGHKVTYRISKQHDERLGYLVAACRVMAGILADLATEADPLRPLNDAGMMRAVSLGYFRGTPAPLIRAATAIEEAWAMHPGNDKYDVTIPYIIGEAELINLTWSMRGKILEMGYDAMRIARDVVLRQAAQAA